MIISAARKVESLSANPQPWLKNKQWQGGVSSRLCDTWYLWELIGISWLCDTWYLLGVRHFWTIYYLVLGSLLEKGINLAKMGKCDTWYLLS